MNMKRKLLMGNPIGCYAVSLCKQLLTSRRMVVPPSLGSSSLFLTLLGLNLTSSVTIYTSTQSNI